jgi:hypothetical protein
LKIDFGKTCSGSIFKIDFENVNPGTCSVWAQNGHFENGHFENCRGEGGAKKVLALDIFGRTRVITARAA